MQAIGRRFDPCLLHQYYRGVGESSRPRQSHKLEIGGANPSPATIFLNVKVYMAIKQLSRGTTFDTETCVEMVGGNRFDLVLIAAVRARELARQHRHAENKGQLNAPVTALLDIQEGRVGREYLKRIR